MTKPNYYSRRHFNKLPQYHSGPSDQIKTWIKDKLTFITKNVFCIFWWPFLVLNLQSTTVRSGKFCKILKLLGSDLLKISEFLCLSQTPQILSSRPHPADCKFTIHNGYQKETKHIDQHNFYSFSNQVWGSPVWHCIPENHYYTSHTLLQNMNVLQFFPLFYCFPPS